MWVGVWERVEWYCDVIIEFAMFVCIGVFDARAQYYTITAARRQSRILCKYYCMHMHFKTRTRTRTYT